MKKNLGLIMGICALVFCVLNVIGFFIPTVVAKEDSSVKLSSFEIAFYNKDSASDKASELTKQKAKDIAEGKYKLDSKEAKVMTNNIAKFTALASIKAEEKTNTNATFAAVMHFISVLISLAVIVMVLIALLKKNFVWTNRFLAIGALVFMLLSMIGYICFFSTTVGSGVLAVKVAEVYACSAGMILSLIASVFACVSTFIPFKKK